MTLVTKNQIEREVRLVLKTRPRWPAGYIAKRIHYLICKEREETIREVAKLVAAIHKVKEV